MDMTSFVFKQALKGLKIPPQAIEQLRIAQLYSDVNGNGFPRELFELSIPMVTRGLLNFAVLQMKSNWIYPRWVHQQLDPASVSFLPRSQNPLFLNISHRNWTLLGSPHGKYEAIVDPCGLLTPLPREWSLDCWLVTPEGAFFPSLMTSIKQTYDTTTPLLTTNIPCQSLQIKLETFVEPTNHQRDVVFQRISVQNESSQHIGAAVGVAIRPFNPEGVAPIYHIEWNEERLLFVNQQIGVVFSEQPTTVLFSNGDEDDAAISFRDLQAKLPLRTGKRTGTPPYKISCLHGLANAVAIYRISLSPSSSKNIYCSIALATEEELKHSPSKRTWRVSFESRKERHRERWNSERSKGALIKFGNNFLQQIFDANLLTLLQLHDEDFISPGPYLYHHYWFRDAVPMAFALDRLGFHTRVHTLIKAFPQRQTSSGFFRAPDGEWDSNGAVLWLLEQHYKLHPSITWLRNFFPSVRMAVQWILKKRLETSVSTKYHKGLLPPSLSAEHFGTVDQYYWDSFWSLAGLRSAVFLARTLQQEKEAIIWQHEANVFANTLSQSLKSVEQQSGKPLITASPSRHFDQSAVGFVAGIYPLQIMDVAPKNFRFTLHEFVHRFVNEKGYYHPLIHSGYNAYLTLQLAHAYLFYGKTETAWRIANTIFHQCTPPYSLPEAIHPRTGGGSMGDGHHGWAAAEIVLFLLDCYVRQEQNALLLFPSVPAKLFSWGTEIVLDKVPTFFGTLSCLVSFPSVHRSLCEISLRPVPGQTLHPRWIDIFLPFPVTKVLPSPSSVSFLLERTATASHIRLFSDSAKLILER